MPHFNVSLPVDKNMFNCELCYLFEFGQNSILDYLQTSRSKSAKIYPEYVEQQAKLFPNELNKHINSLLKILDVIGNIDVIVSAPSKTNYHQPLFENIKEKYCDSIDLTTSFSKVCGLSSGGTRDFEKVIDNIGFNKNSEIEARKYENILIVDDFVADGKTIAAILQRLNNSGFYFNKHIVACILINPILKNSKLSK